MTNTNTIKLVSIVITLLCYCPVTWAADITREVKSRNSGFFELGLGVGYSRAPLAGFYDSDVAGENFGDFGVTIQINGQWQWRNLFVEVLHDSFTGVAVGLQAWQNQNNSVDVIVTNLFTDLNPANSGFSGLDIREYDIVAGLRSTHHLENSVLQFSLLGDVSDRHNGWAATASYGRFWQLRNWNLHAIGGALYFSDRVNQHFFGVSATQGSASVPAYAANGGAVLELELGATVPLNEKWVFRSTAEYYHLPDALTDSPLVGDDNAYTFQTSINYVF